jgi:hypothetical protein
MKTAQPLGRFGMSARLVLEKQRIDKQQRLAKVNHRAKLGRRAEKT